MPILDIDATLAVRNLTQHAHSRWSNITAINNRAFVGSDFFRPKLHKPFSLNPASAGYILGSCFAQEVQFALGRRGVPLRSSIADAPKRSWFLQDPSACLLDAPPDESVLQAGTAYWPLHFFHRFDPASMLQELENILSKSPSIANGELLFERPDGLFADYHYDPRFQLQTLQDCIDRRIFVRQRINALIDVDFVILTLGLIEAWLDTKSGLYLNRSPGLDLIERFPARFRLQVLGEAEVCASLTRILELLYGANADMKIVLTVSPVPMAATFTGADVALANANSKATLLCALNRLLPAFPRVCYFPSYEIVTHSSRAAVWSADGRHVRPEFVERIMDFFFSEMTAAE